MRNLPKAVSQKALHQAATEMIESNLSVEEVCAKSGIDADALARFLRLHRRDLKKEISLTEEPEEVRETKHEEAPISAVSDRQLLRPKAQQGETALLHAIVVEKDLGELVDDPLEMGLVDSKGKSIPFERIFLLSIVGVFACSLLYFGLGDILSEKETVAPELVPEIPHLPSDLNLVDQAAETMFDFVNAKGAENKATFVRRPDIVIPLMQKWYASHPPGKYEWDEWKGRAFALNDKNFLTVTFYRDNDLSSIDALFEIPETGHPQLDWESFVGYAPFSWEEFRDIRPVDAMAVRVYFEPSELYYPPFDNTERFAPARLTHPQSTVPLIGYVQKGTSAALLLRDLVNRRRTNSKYPIIAEIRFPQGEGVDPNLVEITRVIQTNWITQYPEATKSRN